MAPQMAYCRTSPHNGGYYMAIIKLRMHLSPDAFLREVVKWCDEMLKCSLARQFCAGVYVL